MIIIAFCKNTSRILPRLLCHRFKHVAPIGVYPDCLILHQFINRKHIKTIKLDMRDLKILQKYDWRFIYLTGNLPNEFYATNARTCVQMTKTAIRLRNIFIQTPNALYKYLQYRYLKQ
ncbi:MAG: hypothetical protein IKZ34_03215 [Alphaproteobacteria bacterium]|nr:hypothetical protein [Alphaproteobacteria bacterium]